MKKDLKEDLDFIKSVNGLEAFSVGFRNLKTDLIFHHFNLYNSVNVK